MSKISPSTSYFGIAIQSPVLNMRFAAIWIPATKPKIVSLNMSNNTAAIAVIPDNRINGLLLIKRLITSKAVMMVNSSLAT